MLRVWKMKGNGQEAFETFIESPAGTYSMILMDIQI